VSVPLVHFLGDADKEAELLRLGTEKWATRPWLRAHRAELHDPSNPDAEPCCPECCDCQDVENEG
jgi:hypothetical protein